MEKDLFDWEDVDIIDEGHLKFYRCRLKVGLGNFKLDMVVPIIEINFDSGTMILYEADGQQISEHKLGLTIKI
jgi:hypothetical protein